MIEWVYLAGYLVGWLVTCRLLGRYFFTKDDGLFIVGIASMLWPIVLAMALATALITGPAWLATRGLRR